MLLSRYFVAVEYVSLPHTSNVFQLEKMQLSSGNSRQREDLILTILLY